MSVSLNTPVCSQRERYRHVVCTYFGRLCKWLRIWWMSLSRVGYIYECFRGWMFSRFHIIDYNILVCLIVGLSLLASISMSWCDKIWTFSSSHDTGGRSIHYWGINNSNSIGHGLFVCFCDLPRLDEC